MANYYECQVFLDTQLMHRVARVRDPASYVPHCFRGDFGFAPTEHHAAHVGSVGLVGRVGFEPTTNGL